MERNSRFFPLNLFTCSLPSNLGHTHKYKTLRYSILYAILSRVICIIHIITIKKTIQLTTGSVICHVLYSLAAIIAAALFLRATHPIHINWTYIVLAIYYVADIHISLMLDKTNQLLLTSIALNLPIKVAILVFFIRYMLLIHAIMIIITYYIWSAFAAAQLHCSVELLASYYIGVIFISYVFLMEKKSKFKYITKMQNALDNWRVVMDICPIGFIITKQSDSSVMYKNSETDTLLKEFKSTNYSEVLVMMEKGAKQISNSSKIINFDTKQIEWREQTLIYNNKPSKLHILIDSTASKEFHNDKIHRKYIEMLVATSTHELRTPLNGIKNNILLTKDYCSSKGIEFIDKCISACELQEVLINDIMDFAKLQENNFKLNISHFDVTKLIKDCSDIIEIQTQAKGLIYTYAIDENVPEKCNSDERRIKQIILNLLSNALKFTMKGFISIKVKYKRDRLKFIIEDTGIGISEENVHKLFKPFGMIDSSQNINKSGTGLGLNLSSTLCRHLGGDIKVSSKVGSYTKFSFFVKDYKTSSPELISKEMNEAGICTKRRAISRCSSMSSSKNFHTLLVDDVPLNLSVGKSMLTKLGESVLLASNGAEALTTIMSNHDKIKLALIDLNMPVMDGYKLCENVVNLINENKIQRFTMVALTGEDRNEVIDICRSTGFADVIMKPLSLKDLKHLIDNNYQAS